MDQSSHAKPEMEMEREAEYLKQKADIWGKKRRLKLVMKHNTRSKYLRKHKTCQNESNTHVIVKQSRLSPFGFFILVIFYVLC
jgi:hypothetical protein